MYEKKNSVQTVSVQKRETGTVISWDRLVRVLFLVHDLYPGPVRARQLKRGGGKKKLHIYIYIY